VPTSISCVSATRARSLARRLGVKLPIYPIGLFAGDSIGTHEHPPTIGSVDENSLVAISRFGDRMRVTAAEFAGYDTRHTARDFDFMVGVAGISIRTAPTTMARSGRGCGQ
jgi:hypothetical protein